ncbi:MAG: TIGR03619 family F420-dependent LLM class oxidoreductase [Halioglobus sp.]
MRFSFHPVMCPVEQYVPLAIAAEEAGFDCFTYPDSLAFPRESSTTYPYNDDGNREFLDGVPFIEPFVGIPYLAAVTEKIRFSTSVYKLAVRQPVAVAKQLSSLAVVTDNRFDFGVGISPWPEDFEACQIAWEKRGLRLSEMIQIIQGLMKGEYFEFQGKIFDIDAMKMCPIPDQPVPILIGGHSEPALKRAAKLGDGWIAASCPVDEYKVMIDKIKGYRKEYCRDHLPFAVQAMSKDSFSLEGLDALSNVGVDEVVIAFSDPYKAEPETQSLEEKIGMINWYAENFIQPGKERHVS